ncbi:Zn-dependent protease (includes SpoIVFB) [Sporobacter termitidis DSM 10068]|uniref:Zn-dependent protease (Includes SpoIVFB) n=1 Tax=Sporobacter termitidis DSM 10068 TaxID=1123282 RepID=A0A1M5TJZ7_9FIRM|nr:site-2 protease family protein [Sporobacter termitidis]SHH51034.1 Zn-dependent protease (includes SpoIVFB) [Sporobacter termitidis DSM 10068]
MANILNNLNWATLIDMAISLVAALACIIFHELSHGYIAYRLGDKTAKEMGRLTLNPLKHIDPIGLLAFVLLKFGWAKPVQVDPRNFKNPKRGMAITALAGPASNFVLAVLMMFILGFVLPFLKPDSIILELLFRVASFSIVLGIFNLVPLPPLDGSKILFAAASDELWMKLMRYERYGFIVLLVLVMLPATSNLLGKATNAVFYWLFEHVTLFSAHLVGFY